MRRTAAAAMLCTAMFTAGAQAATRVITASGITFSGDGLFAPGGATEVPIGSTITLTRIVPDITPTYDAASGEYVERSRGPGSAGITGAGGAVLWDLSWPDNEVRFDDDFVIDAAFNALYGGVLPLGAFDMINIDVEMPLIGATHPAGEDYPHRSSTLRIFAPTDTLETWTSFDDLDLNSLDMLIQFYSRTYDIDPGTGAVTLVESDGWAAVSSLSISAVPLPAAAPLLIAGIAGLGFAGRRRIKA